MGEAAVRDVEAAPLGAMGKYSPFARLGCGGMADIFLAVARGPIGFNKLAVVKRLRNPDDAEHARMFLDEARLSARLSHPNIVHTYDVGEARGEYFLAMEYLEGQPLQAVLERLASRGEGLDDELAAYVAAQVLKALHYAHELCDYDGSPLGVVHRDVSPQNVFLTYGGEVKLLDFGIAKAKLNATQTETGVLKGKIRYMAPEQIGNRNVDRRIDLFAMGIVLWEMLARRKLFEGDAIAVVTQIAGEDAPPLRGVRPDVPQALEAIVARALRRDREERYATAEAMRADLDAYLRAAATRVSDETLAARMNALFAETRDQVRARVQAFLAVVPSVDSDTPNAVKMPRAAELLPVLSGEASGKTRVPDAETLLATAHEPSATSPRPREAREPRGVVTAATVAIAALALVAAAALALLGARPAPTVAASLAPAAPAAETPAPPRVHLTSHPPGALIERNGRPVDRTPADVVLEPGAQTLVVSREGYEPEIVRVEARAGVTLARDVVLRAKAPAPPSPPASQSAPPSEARARVVRAVAPKKAPTATTTTDRPKIRLLDEEDVP